MYLVYGKLKIKGVKCQTIFFHYCVCRKVNKMPCFDEFSFNSKYYILLHLLLVTLLLKHEVNARKKANGNFKNT